MERINAAIIGMGFIGRQHYEALRRLGNVRIRALCVSRPEKIAQAQQEFDADYVTADWRKIMEDPAVQVAQHRTRRDQSGGHRGRKAHLRGKADERDHRGRGARC